MKKIVLTVIFSITVLLSFGFVAHASTLDNIDIYLKYDALDRMMSTEQKAPTSITDAGEERIDTYTGGVSYYSEELNLPGKNGLDLVVGRKFNSAADIDIWGESQYISVKDYRNVDYPTEACKYVFPYHLSEDCSDEPIFVAFDTIWHMLQAEDGTTTITVSSSYEDEVIDLLDTNDDYEWGIDGSYDAGLDFDTDMYIYDDIAGSNVTLYRDLSKECDVIWSSRPTSKVFIQDISYTKVISLGGGWEYDVPVVLGWEDSYLGSYDCMYGIFYDSYQKESVCYRIKYNYDTDKVLSASCYYTSRPITDSESPSTGTRRMYTIEADMDDGYFYYTITRNDGVKFTFYEDELQSMTDRFGNTITYDYTTLKRIVITDTLGRVATLTSDGITVNGEQIVSYIFDRYNDEVEDPNEYYYEDDWGTFTASYKVGTSSTKNIVYNHSQRARIFYLTGNAPLCTQTVGYTKMVLDDILLPTGAQRIYDYGEIERRQYFNSSSKTDYACISRYDIQADSTTEENWQEYDYGEKSATPTTITTFPGRADYTITETFDSEGCVTTRVTACEDLEYTITENYTYTTVDGEFRIDEETVTKEAYDGSTASYVKEYTYDAYTHNVKTMKQDGTLMYKAAYGDNGLLSYEYNIYGTDEYRGVKNTISNGVITTKKYVTLSSSSDSTPTTEETITYTYDEYGNIATSDEDGKYVEYTYEYGDYSDGATPNYSIIVTETYPEVENITNSQGEDIPAANVTRYAYYDKWGNLVKSVDGEGNITNNTYDYRGRLLTVTNPDNTKQIYSYNDTTNRIYMTNENGKRTMRRYDGLGRELALYYLNEAGTTWAITYYQSYDSYGNMMGHSPYRDGIADCTTKYTYYSDNSVKTERLRNRISGDILMQNIYTYSVADVDLNAVSIERKMNDDETVTITNYTNQYGYKVKDTIDDGYETVEQTYTIDVSGNIKEVYDLNGNKAHKYTYDYRGRVLKDTHPIGSSTNVYDGAFLYQVKDGLSNVVKTYEYNTQGQLIRETTPIDDDTDNVVEYYYDRNGNLTKTVTTTGDGTTSRTITNIYDNRNRVIAANDGSGYYTRYEYDNMANITRMATGVPTYTEELDRDTHSVTDYEYSYRDFLVGVTDPMGYTESYTHNSRGTVLTFTDKNGTLFEYTYNGAPWLLSKTATGTDGTEQTISYTYDCLGNVTQMVDENGTTVYTYDRLGNVLTETRGSLVKEYEYDANGNRTYVDITDGTFEQSLTYVYDANNRLTKVTDENGYTNYTYDANNRVLTKKSYNSDKSAVRAYSVYTYLDSGLLNTKKNYKYSTASTTYLIDDYALTYYADGNIATVDNNDAITTYLYDSAGRLSRESIEGTVQAIYTYDAFGNRATKTESISTTTYTYDKNNRLVNENMQSDYGPNNIAYVYDSNGNLLSKSGDSSATYTFDLFGRMATSAVNGVTSTYAYDGNGIRTSKAVGGETTNFINDGAYVVGEVCGDGIIKYTYGTDLISIDNNGTLGYYHTDEHGNVSAISDVDRTVVADYDFDAFGNETVSTDSYYNPMRYCGEYYDDETGLIYLRARYYDPYIGRFVSEDPVKDGTNWYVYCNNNPVVSVDSNGLWIETAFDAVSFAWSVGDVICNPTDPWAWAGLAGDAVDFIPVVTGVGEAIKGAGAAARVADDVADIGKATKKVEDLIEAKSLTKNHSRGARWVPKDLKESLAMESVLSNPSGKTIVERGSMNDSRWPGSEGWVKKAQNVNGVEIHYNYNEVTGAYDDFKFK